MNNIEFIDKQIDIYTNIKNRAILVIPDEDDEIELCKLKDKIDICNERISYFKQIKAELEAWKEKEKGVRVFKESKQDALCPICHYYINFDCLNEELKYAPKYCCKCGTKIIFTKEDVLKH